MPGRMGGQSVTVTGLRIVDLDVDNKFVFISGALPGPINQEVRISVKASSEEMENQS
jgi:ribosomal protein L3